jgi:hypothetical protein
MYSHKRIVAVLLVLMGSAILLAANDTAMGTAAKRTVTFSQATLIGDTLVPAGEYTLTHEMQGQTHIMDFKQLGGKAEVKSKCNMVPLKEKAVRSEQRFAVNAKQQRVLKAMVFRGDTVEHILDP